MGINSVQTNGDKKGVPPGRSEYVNGTTTTESEHVDVPVLVIGGGPTGLLQAHLLSRMGVQSLLVERYPERLGAPKAHALSPRSLEISRQCGLDVARIRQLGTKREDALWVNFLTNLSGEAVGRLPYERMDPGVLEETPEMIHNIPQPTFEQFLSEYLARDENVVLRKGVSFVSLVQFKDYITTTVEELATGQNFQIRSRHVIACDGANSKVRKFLQIESEGGDSYETMMTIHINANLRPVVKDRVGMLHWVMDPEAAGFIIAYDLAGNAVLISNFDAEKHPVDTWNEDLCRKVVCAAIGQDVPFDIHSYRPWLLSCKVANRYRVGNVFLAGDAAHSFPPTGGLGLNSGLADVHNLAYKIAAVHRGWALDSILESYQTDRRPVAMVNSMQSVKNGKKIFGLLKALGTAGSSDLARARRNLYETIHNPKKKMVIDEGIEGQREHFDNLELHIGYVYGSTELPPNASNYVPKYCTGARLPHAWISINTPETVEHLPEVNVSYVKELSDVDIGAFKYSTLDLCAAIAFTIILNSKDASTWQPRIEQVRSHFNDTGSTLNIRYLGDDFDVVPSSRSHAWIEGAGLNASGGLLVRPDQHILMPLRAETTLEDILDTFKAYTGL